ncbi:MAG: hypothetical protein ABR881_21900 [Candidatus Sulfotelmatobacter sp.]
MFPDGGVEPPPALTPPQESKNNISRSSIVKPKTWQLHVADRVLAARQVITIPGNSKHSA